MAIFDEFSQFFFLNFHVWRSLAIGSLHKHFESLKTNQMCLSDHAPELLSITIAYAADAAYAAVENT